MMDMIFRLITNTRPLATIIILLSCASLGGALISEHFFGLFPCVLCKYQRMVYVVLIFWGALALMTDKARPKLASRFIALSGLTFLTGAYIAGFHVGVEQKWWTGTESCGGQLPPPGASLEELRKAIMNAPSVRCDEVPWDMFGISMAGYNFALSLFMGLLLLWAFRRISKNLKNT